MIARRIAAAALLASLPVSLLAQDTLPPGVWANTEDEYFAEEEGREKPLWWAVRVAEDGKWQLIDPFGQALDDWTHQPIELLSRREGGGWQIDGSEIRRARPMSCWVSVRKFAGKPDGSADWTFANNLEIFDQGGRVLVSGEGLAPDVTIRVRNVTWAKGSRNKPALVLYAHKQDPVRAESYSWASPDASLIGINLRWMQASCSRVEE